MRILFLLRSLDLGGLEVVTAVLANKFIKEGHRVFVYAFEERTGNIRSRFDKDVLICVGQGYHISKRNIKQLRNLINEERINIVVNQWGLPLIPIEVLEKAKKGLDLRVISVYHNDPLKNSRIQNVETDISRTNNTPWKLILKVKKCIYRIVTGYSMRYVYGRSDLYEVLSPSYIQHFKKFTKLNDVNRLVVQANPVTIDCKGFEYNQKSKEKEIIYVGRLDYTQKRVHRIIDMWKCVEHIYTDWKLTIIGDGDELDNLRMKVRELKLSNVFLEGFKFPRPYYERASILVLTSEFEGFPLVLAECMSFGVVPVVYGSYSAVFDIIDDDIDGVIVPQNLKGFDPALMAEKMGALMNNPKRLGEMAESAIKKSCNYSIDKVYEQWINVFDKLVTDGQNRDS